MVEVESRPPPSRAEGIHEELREQILSGRFQPGERLPSERDLVARTGANRSSVREALKKLETLGLIEIKPGGGARVKPIEQANLDVLQHLSFKQGKPNLHLIAQWLDVQEILLTGQVRMLVEAADEETIVRARALVERIREARSDARRLNEIFDELEELLLGASDNLVLSILRNRLLQVFELSYPNARRKTGLPEGAELLLDDLDRSLVQRDAIAVSEHLRTLMRLRKAYVLTLLRSKRNR